MNDTKEQTLFQQFFRSEITWLGMVVIAVWGFVATTVLPLQKLQIQVGQLQEQIANQTASNALLANQYQTISGQQQADEAKLQALQSLINRIFPPVK